MSNTILNEYLEDLESSGTSSKDRESSDDNRDTEQNSVANGKGKNTIVNDKAAKKVVHLFSLHANL